MLWRFSLLSCCMLLALSACGFSPVYRSNNLSGQTQLSGVSVAGVAGRNGQVLHTKLEDLLDPQAKNGGETYMLEAGITVEYIPVIIENDGTVSRYRVDIIIPLTLKNSQTNQLMLTDTVRRSVSYNVSDSDYSSYISSTDAVERGIVEAAYDVVQRVAAALTPHETY